MDKTPTHRFRGLAIALLIVLALVVLLPVALLTSSLFGRIETASAIPDGFSVAAHVPRASGTARRVASHEMLSSLLADPAFSAAVPIVSLLNEANFPGQGFLFAALNGELDAAAYPDGHWIAAMDMGMLSSTIRLLPFMAARMTVENLYYVQAGKLSRFEYRDPSGNVVYAGFRNNLLVASDSPVLFESVLSGAAHGSALASHDFGDSEFDAGFLADPSFIMGMLPKDNPALAKLASSLSWNGMAELTARVERAKLEVSVSGVLSSSIPTLQAILGEESSVPSLLSRLPESTQYETLVSVGQLTEVIDLWKELVPGASETLSRADRSARLLFGAGLDELLFDWAGPDVAVFGLEGRPKPVFAVRIADEAARKRAFDRILSSLAVSGDDSTVLDGYRISRITMPDFLSGLLSLFAVKLPAPYWIVDDGYFLASESPETLLSAVSARRKGETLARDERWISLAGSGSARASVSLYYTLDRSVPFFLKGSLASQNALRLYREGYLSLGWAGGKVTVNLSAIPGSGGGLAPIPGFPVEAAPAADSSGTPETLGREVSVIKFTKKGGSRIICLLGDRSIGAWNPAGGTWARYEGGAGMRFAIDPSAQPENPESQALWAVTADGEVSLLDGNLKPVEGFPIVTGIRPSSAPMAFGGRLYLSDPDSSLRAIDSNGGVEIISMPFTDPLRSPPTAYVADGKTIFAMYPKSFFSQVWLTDTRGTPFVGWPRQLSGIAYGSPVVYGRNGDVRVAFVTQAGDLFHFDVAGEAVSGFPVRLEGVFYAQPVWDGTFFWALSADGTLWNVDEAGNVRSQSIPSFAAESAYLRATDIDGDGTAEIFATGDGNTLHGYSSSFAALGGFPLPGWGRPWIGDMNGDGTVDCVAAAMDNTIGAWQFRKERSK